MDSISSMATDDRTVVQIAFVVDDLEEACLQWVRTFGAGPFFIHDPVRLGQVIGPDGSPGVFEQASAFGQWGAVMIELVRFDRVEPVEAARVLLQPGFSHAAYFATHSEDEVRRLEEAGAPMLMKLALGPHYCHLHDATNTVGFIVEHYPFQAVERNYRMVSEAAASWDGRDPIRRPAGM
jgi:hypothetical protein